jgi:hypothetical protein
MANVQGTTALQRHPDADLNDYVNRGIAALRRELDVAIPDQRFLASTTVPTVAGTSLYALPADFNHLVSIDLEADGVKVWLVPYEMHERPMLTDDSVSYTGIPFTYRLRGGNIELLPTPQAVYTATVWYVSDPSTLSSDASTLDTITRLDDFVIAYAAKLVALKDNNQDKAASADGLMAMMRDEIAMIARSRDKNAPSRIVDEMLADRWGRHPRGWRR